MKGMNWRDSVIWWHVYPLGFTGAEQRLADAAEHPVHRLEQVRHWLDYATSLGANGLLLGPVFRSASHGYDTLDHFQVDPRLGDVDDLTRLIGDCVSHGTRIVLDGVFNHVCRDHAIVTQALADGPDSPAGRWIRWVDGHPRAFEGHERLIELNVEHPEVIDYLVTVATHWLDLGIDGWRLDAAYAAGPDAWRPIIDAVRAHRPDTWFVGEVIHGDYADFVTRSGVDTLTQYELWKGIWSSIQDTNFFELAHALNRHQEMLQTFVPYTFLGNHDTTRIASQISDERHLPHAYALLALLPGIPAIYSGDEHGFTGEKFEGEHGDDAVRPAFPASPDQLLPFGAATFELHQRLLGLRRRHPWLTRASVSTRDLHNASVVVELRSPDGPERLDLALNLADAPLPLPAGEVLTGSDTSSGSVPPHGWTVVRAG